MQTSVNDSLKLGAIVPLFPLLLAQGVWTRRTVPRIGEAAGPNFGTVQGNGRSLNLVMVGESTVAGVCAKTYETSLAAWTAVSLHQQTGQTIHWQAIGQNGIRARATRLELLPKIGQQPDLLFVGLGVNDVTHFSSRSQWQQELRGLFQDMTLRWGSVPIIMSGLPPMHQFPALPQPLRWYLGERAAIYDQLAQHICADFINVTYLPLPKLDMAAYFCEDQFHPSELGYEKWGEILATAVVQRGLVDSASE